MSWCQNPHGLRITYSVAKRLDQTYGRIRAQLHPGRVGYVVAGYSVPHAHLLGLSSHHAHDITCEHFAVQQAGKIVFTDEHIPLAPREELDRMAALLRLA